VVDHARNKARFHALLNEIAEAEGDAIRLKLEEYCHEDVQWDIFHPFNTLHGIAEADARFWAPLKESFPDYELRMSFLIAGEYEGREYVSALGHVMGSFAAPWLGIPPTHGLNYLRIGINAKIVEGKFARVYILLDVVDLMRQAGYYPFRRMPGSPEQWIGPPVGSGASVDSYDPDVGAVTLLAVREMQRGLGKGKQDLTAARARDNHSPHWHKDMNWYGVAGIGSSRGKRGYLDYHGALFILAFPDRKGWRREPDAPEDAPGHYIEIGDGHFAVTAGAPSLEGTHLGGGWLGLPPTGRHLTMRVADWYRTDAGGKIIDNWVMIDVLDMLMQMDFDVLDDLRYFADPALPRWPR
jgi:hypothetical protein